MSLGSYKYHEGAIHGGACPFMNRHTFPSCTYKYCGLNHQSIQSIIHYILSFTFTLQHVITHCLSLSAQRKNTRRRSLEGKNSPTSLLQQEGHYRKTSPEFLAGDLDEIPAHRRSPCKVNKHDDSQRTFHERHGRFHHGRSGERHHSRQPVRRCSSLHGAGRRSPCAA